MTSTLRIQFDNYLALQRYSPKTREAYISAVAGLAGYYLKPPDQLTNNEIHK